MTSLPTVAESAVPGFGYGLWGGLFAVADTRDHIVNLLNKELNAFLSDPKFGKRWKATASLRAITPSGLRRIRAEVA